MIAVKHRWPVGATTWAGIVCALLAPPCTGSVRAQGVPAVTPPAAVSASDVPSAEPAFKALVERYYDGVARKDIAAVEQVWHTGGLARSQRNLVAMDFELRDVSLVSLNLSGVAVDAGTRPRQDPPTLVAVANPVPGKAAEERIALLRTAPAFVPDVYRSRLARLEGRPAGRSWAESIQRAAKRQFAKPSTRHPYYWAGLLVIGP